MSDRIPNTDTNRNVKETPLDRPIGWTEDQGDVDVESRLTEDELIEELEMEEELQNELDGEDAYVEMEEDTPAEIDVLQAEIAVTRIEIGSTVDELKERLAPATLAREAKESIRDATVGRAKQTAADAVDTTRETAGRIVETTQDGIQHAMEITRGKMEQAKVKIDEVKETAQEKLEHLSDSARGSCSMAMDGVRRNPVPLALIGMGLGWMLVSARSRRNDEAHTGHDYWYPDSPDAVTDPADPRYRRRELDSDVSGITRGVAAFESEADADGESTGTQVRNLAGHWKDKVSETSDQARETLRDAKEKASERVGQMAEQTQARMEQVRSGAMEQAERASDRFQHLIRENPFAVGAAAFALGSIVGYLLPASAPEKNVVGDVGEKLVTKTRETAREMSRKVQEVARETAATAMETARQEAESRGLANG